MFYFAGLVAVNMQFDAKLLNMQFDAKLLNHHKLFNLNQTVENYIKTAILYITLPTGLGFCPDFVLGLTIGLECGLPKNLTARCQSLTL